ncbi:hypothetical protein LOK74_04865 [Brevibacillus humidisoli]|uniref:hypothetical protein n=1 Tax=Brevibacillus humidisoli TaxID=2895522 RepID=UPI001E3B6442|nr:hypothetical protein [Brevibacillus humidisoli]UFJ41838.1 hypothetical protein LOK74_04865 [Brevibacillus humidisoli]
MEELLLSFQYDELMTWVWLVLGFSAGLLYLRSRIVPIPVVVYVQPISNTYTANVDPQYIERYPEARISILTLFLCFCRSKVHSDRVPNIPPFSCLTI